VQRSPSLGANARCLLTDFTECFKRSICCLIRNPKRDITYAWLVSLVLVLISFIVACVVASKLQKSNDAIDQASSFSVVWTCLLLILISIVGTVIMRSFQTALSIGFLLGVIFIMTQQMLIIFAIFAELAGQGDNSTAQTSSQEAMAVFAFFLFVVYSAFGSMLAVFRNDVIKEEVLQVDPAEADHDHKGGEYGYAEEDNQM
jgi:cytochrome bd-type quinol oxidase subunit 2